MIELRFTRERRDPRVFVGSVDVTSRCRAIALVPGGQAVLTLLTGDQDSPDPGETENIAGPYQATFDGEAAISGLGWREEE